MSKTNIFYFYFVVPPLTTGRVDDVSQLGVLPLAQVVLFHAGSGFGRLHLRTPAERNGRASVGETERLTFIASECSR